MTLRTILTIPDPRLKKVCAPVIAFDETLRIEDAGAFAAEIEIVPFKVAEYISNKVKIFMIGMGSGQGCDAQYLFAEDVLGYNKGHIPRHAKVYANLSEDYENFCI